MTENRPIRMAVVMIAILALMVPALIRASDEGEKTDRSAAPSAELPKPLVIPAEASKRPNPVPDVKEAIEAGGAMFAIQCAMCHGENGKGRGDLALSLQMKVPDLTDSKLQSKRTDGDLFYIVSTGHGQMPGEKRLPESTLWEMIRFIRTLKQ